MGITTKVIALFATIALLSGCFGYNKSAKRWAYVGNTVLILGGGALIGTELANKEEPCMVTVAMPRCRYEAPFSGPMVVGAVLAAAGLFGLFFNATRPYVKTSR